MMLARNLSRLAATAAIVVAAAAAFACGGGGGSSSTPTTPTSPTSPTLPTGNACGALSGFTSTPQTIVNGLDCSAQVTTASVVSVRSLDAAGRVLGFCSGTVIAADWVLTAAHCLNADTQGVSVYLGVGLPIVATEYHFNPTYTGPTADAQDVGVVRFPAGSLGRTPIALLTSRDAAIGETGVIAGFGQSGGGEINVLRAGTVSISEVAPFFISSVNATNGSNICAGDSGGPLLISQGGGWAIAGITSSATAYCTSGTSYYTRIKNGSILSYILGYVPNVSQR